MAPPRAPPARDYSIHTDGAHFAEVGVDVDTAEIRLRRMLSVFAVGCIFDPKTARSQLIGGDAPGWRPRRRWPLDRVMAQSEDLGLMFEWFDRVGYSADIAGLRREYPEVGWQTFEAWARTHART